MNDNTIKNHINNKDIHVSKKYIDSRIKDLEDIVNDHVNNTSNAHTINSMHLFDNKDYTDEWNNEAILQQKSNKTDITADYVITDPMHRFITDSTLKELKEKPNKSDMDDAILKNNIAMINNINSKLDMLLNSKDIVNNLRLLSDFLNSNAEKLPDNSQSIDFLQEHLANTDSHVSSKDRLAINILLSLVDDSFADWNADKDSPNFIKNKPESLKANGGNADTVCNYSLSDIMKNKSLATIVIGCKGIHNLDDVNLLCDGNNDSDVFNKAIELASKHGGKIFIREGIYKPLEINITNSIELCGCGTASEINSSNINITNATINNISIADSKINIYGKNSRISNSNFNNCSDVFLNNCESCIITLNIFNITNVKYKGLCYNNLVVNNIFKNSTRLFYSGGNNIIDNNIYA